MGNFQELPTRDPATQQLLWISDPDICCGKHKWDPEVEMNEVVAAANVDAHAFRSFVARLDEIKRRTLGLSNPLYMTAIIVGCAIVGIGIGLPLRLLNDDPISFGIGVSLPLVCVLCGIGCEL